MPLRISRKPQSPATHGFRLPVPPRGELDFAGEGTAGREC